MDPSSEDRVQNKIKNDLEDSCGEGKTRFGPPASTMIGRTVLDFVRLRLPKVPHHTYPLRNANSKLEAKQTNPGCEDKAKGGKSVFARGLRTERIRGKTEQPKQTLRKLDCHI